MKNGLRIALATAALAAGLAVAAPAPANAQVGISVQFGDPFFEVGSFVPSHYAVVRHPRYGHGFYYRSRWIPVRSYGRRWIVCDAPVVYSGYSDGFYSGPYYEPYVYSYRPYVYSRPYGYYGYGSWGGYGGYYGRHGGWGHGWGHGWGRH